MQRILVSVIICLSVLINVSGSEPVKVFSTPDLAGLAKRWADEYNRSGQGYTVSIINAEQGNIQELTRSGLIGFVPGASLNAAGTGWRMMIGRDIIVPVVNSGNPLIEQIRKKGVSPERLSAYFSGGTERTWGTLLSIPEKIKAELYCMGDRNCEAAIMALLDLTEKPSGARIANDARELLALVRNDKTAIGFCRLVDILDPSDPSVMENISLMPIDRNSDGIIDHNEDIYNDLNAFTRGVWIGKYPQELVNGIYSVGRVQPTEAGEVSFLNWVLAEGQNYLNPMGFTGLLENERKQFSGRLAAAVAVPAATAGTPSVFRTLFVAIVMFLVIGLIINILAKYLGRKPLTVPHVVSERSVLDAENIILPKGLCFDKTHTWAFMEKDGNVRVGIDDFIRHITGSFSRIGMKKEGEMVKKGEEILTLVRNGKQLTLYAPVSGIVRERNSILDSDVTLLESSPYEKGWIYRIEPLNWSRENQLLQMAERHRSFISEEISKLKDFLAAAMSSGHPEYAVALQDGGALLDSPLAEMGPEVWEEFQLRFIDPSRQVWFYELF